MFETMCVAQGCKILVCGQHHRQGKLILLEFPERLYNNQVVRFFVAGGLFNCRNCMRSITDRSELSQRKIGRPAGPLGFGIDEFIKQVFLEAGTSFEVSDLLRRILVIYRRLNFRLDGVNNDEFLCIDMGIEGEPMIK